MNPESRIKLLRLLEEIRVFEVKNYDSRSWKISAWGTIVLYFVLLFSKAISSIGIKNSSFVLILLFPIFLSSIWLLLRKHWDEKYKVLANAILELGSIAQESPISVTKVNEIKDVKIIKPKRLIKRKKK